MSELSIAESNQRLKEIQKILIGGDLSKLTTAQKEDYYLAVCGTLGLNAMTRPFDWMNFQGKVSLYAKKDCTDQLRKVHGVSVTVQKERTEENIIVTAHAAMPNGRVDEALGATWLGGLKGEAWANAIMKAETKAKRRVTLSICGLGMLDETEVEDIKAEEPAKKVEREVGKLKVSSEPNRGHDNNGLDQPIGTSNPVNDCSHPNQSTPPSAPVNAGREDTPVAVPPQPKSEPTPQKSNTQEVEAEVESVKTLKLTGGKTALEVKLKAAPEGVGILHILNGLEVKPASTYRFTFTEAKGKFKHQVLEVKEIISPKEEGW